MTRKAVIPARESTDLRPGTKSAINYVHLVNFFCFFGNYLALQISVK